MTDRPLGEPGARPAAAGASTAERARTAGAAVPPVTEAATVEPVPPAWTTLSAIRIGSVHLRDDRPLQDAVLTWRSSDRAVVAVADGHGHRTHFRSETGAALAVVSAVEELRRRLPDLAACADPDAAGAVAAEAGAALVASWRDKVGHHLAANPYDSLDGVGPADLLLPYGSTVLATAAAGDFVVFVQLGDGESVVVHPDRTVRRPLPVDPDLEGPFTSSLCQADPLRSLRSAAVPAADVALAFLCTDGFANPQAEADWWQRTGDQLVEFGRTRGWAWVGDQLDGWLEEPARVGGDDTTLAILARP
jgi:hypothetical protein